jgi:hypothetical protein
MSIRCVHSIHSECDIFVQKTGGGDVRLRLREKDPELVSPTDFELEGDPAHIAEALSFIVGVLTNLDALDKEPS